jgi:hypothetical protein
LGHIFVADPGSAPGGTDGRIVFVNPRVPYDPNNPQANQTVIASGFNATLPDPGVVTTELQDPIGITWDPETEDLLVTDMGRILRFSQDGVLDPNATILLPPELPLSVLNDIAIDASGRFLVVGHSLYLTVNALARVIPGGAATTLTTNLNQPKSLAIVPADTDGDGTPDTVDNCPNYSNADQLDTNEDGIGDACQCGDVDGNGVLNTTDALLIARGWVTDPDDVARCDVSGDAEHACNTTDALLIARGRAPTTPQEQTCPAYTGE